MYVKSKSDKESEEFTPNGIIISVINKLNLEVEGKELQCKDRDGAEIDVAELPGIISQYRCSGSFFFVEFCLDRTTTKSINIKKEKNWNLILKMMIILQYYMNIQLKKTLSDSSRRCLVRKAINFLRQRSGNYPKREGKIAFAGAIIQLFPAFKVENKNCGGIVAELYYLI